MTLHLIAEDLENHAWYEELFVSTIADVEAFTARWAAFEEIVYAQEPEGEALVPLPLSSQSVATRASERSER